MESTHGTRWSRSRALAGAIALPLFLFPSAMGASSGLPMTWDEGNAIRRAERVTEWFSRAVQLSTSLKVLSRQSIEEGWPYTIQVEGHPAFYGCVIALGMYISCEVLEPLNSARVGPVLLACFALAVMSYRLARDWSIVAAIGGILGVLSMPRLLAHWHVASFDGPLTSCWVLSWATTGLAMRSRTYAALWGVATGMVMSCKFTGWFAIVPAVTWLLWTKGGRCNQALKIGVPLAFVTFCCLNPPLWYNPIGGLVTFFQLNLGRADHGLNIPGWFFGQLHDLKPPTPGVQHAGVDCDHCPYWYTAAKHSWSNLVCLAPRPLGERPASSWELANPGSRACTSIRSAARRDEAIHSELCFPRSALRSGTPLCVLPCRCRTTWVA